MIRIDTRDNWIFIGDHGSIVAEVGPTFLRNPSYVLLYPTCSPEQRSEVLTFAASKFPRHSWETDLDAAALLAERGIKPIDLKYHTSEEAVAAALELADVPSLRASLGRIPWSDEREVRFRVGREHRFEFWKDVSVPTDPNGMWALHVVPAYHPSMTGDKRHGLINGCTDCNIRDTTVRYVMCPPASAAGRDIKFKSSSWSHVKHPFVAVGRTLDMRISEHHVRTSEGVQALAAYLRAALRLDASYIGISGGFHPPLQHPSNYLGIRYESLRGSEHMCVWEHRVLEREGHLSTAFVPKWLHEENWLGRYENAVEHHGAY